MPLVSKKVTVRGKQGLHARPAALFVQLANKFESAITVQKAKEKVNGKSIMGILMLAAGQGSQIIIEADGPDAGACVEELERLVGQDE